MAILKEIRGNELYLFMNGELIYKRWLDRDYSMVYDHTAYSKYTRLSYRELDFESGIGIMSVQARIVLTETKDGGRKTGIANKYSPNHVFDYNAKGTILQTYAGQIIFEGQETIEPGTAAYVTIRFPEHQPLEKFLYKGRRWWLHEGDMVIGQAEMINDTITIQKPNYNQ